jgi:serine/threonine-protein kinase
VDGTKRLYVRELDEIESVVLPGTENAWRPFFSPNGRWIGFFLPGSPASGKGKLAKISASGGNPVEICDAFPPAGVALDPFQSFLFRVNENGGTPERLTGPGDAGEKEWYHSLPSPVTQRDLLLFSVPGGRGRRHVAFLDMNTGQYKTILEDALGAQFVDSGHIVFARDGALWAVTFDAETGTTGEPAVVQQHIQMNLNISTAPFAISTGGTLIYLPTVAAVTAQRTLVWVDHDGREETVAVPPGKYWWPRVSPDGSRVAMSIQNARGGNEDIWIHEFDRSQSMRRFTFDSGHDSNPLWSADGRVLYFSSGRSGTGDLFRRRADGTGAVEKVGGGPRIEYPADVTADGTTLLYGVGNTETGFDVEELELVGSGNDVSRTSGGGASHPLLGSGFNEGGVKLSPDGKWLVYNTDETNPIQVYVRPYPNLDDGRWQVSTDGGMNATWSADGREIYYRNGTKMMAVAVETEPAFRPGRPRELFDADYFIAPDRSVQYDLEYPSRERFLMIKELPDTRTTRLIYVENWFEELERLTAEAQ